MTTSTVDTAIIAAGISAIISIGVLVAREFLIEPHKWKREAKRETLLKEIEAYGELLNFLDSAEARRKAWKSTTIQVKQDDTHLFLLPGHEIQFNKIFRDNMSFLSNEIIQLYNTFVESDSEYDFAEKRWNPNQNSWYQGLNLSQMHELVRKQFINLRKQYEKNTSFTFS